MAKMCEPYMTVLYPNPCCDEGVIKGRSLHSILYCIILYINLKYLDPFTPTILALIFMPATLSIKGILLLANPSFRLSVCLPVSLSCSQT